eukprot:3202797-Alexandrium_andersonii.AAC.1
MTSSPEVHTGVWTQPPSSGVGHVQSGSKQPEFAESTPRKQTPTHDPRLGSKGIQLGSGQSANRTRSAPIHNPRPENKRTQLGSSPSAMGARRLATLESPCGRTRKFRNPNPEVPRTRHE